MCRAIDRIFFIPSSITPRNRSASVALSARKNVPSSLATFRRSVGPRKTRRNRSLSSFCGETLRFADFQHARRPVVFPSFASSYPFQSVFFYPTRVLCQRYLRAEKGDTLRPFSPPPSQLLTCALAAEPPRRICASKDSLGEITAFYIVYFRHFARNLLSARDPSRGDALSSSRITRNLRVTFNLRSRARRVRPPEKKRERKRDGKNNRGEHARTHAHARNATQRTRRIV